MRFAILTASTAAIVLSSTALLAQEAQEAPAGFDNVYVDVEGAAVQVSIALAAEACGLDETAVRETAMSRLAESGLEPAVMQGAGMEAEGLAASAPAAQAGTAVEISEGALADAGDTGDDAATTGEASGETDVASTDGEASLTSTLAGAETTAAETTTEENASAMPDASNETVTTAQGTADPTTAEPGDEMLALAVCQIDVVTATDLGIPQSNEIVTD